MNHEIKSDQNPRIPLVLSNSIKLANRKLLYLAKKKWGDKFIHTLDFLGKRAYVQSIESGELIYIE